LSDPIDKRRVDTYEGDRQGPVRIREGVPYSDRDTTLSLLPGAAVGEWLADNHAFIRGRLLDCGCGNRPYAAWYAPLIEGSVGLDAQRAHEVDVVGFADSLPFADETFDTVLCTEVLEHVTNAELCVAELFRVTRPGGYVLVTVPYLYPTHELPYDFRRFTHLGLLSVLQRAGFDEVVVEAKGGLGLLVSHYIVLAIVNLLDGIGRKLGLRRRVTQGRRTRPFLWAPQEARIRMRRIPRKVKGSAERASLGYMAVGRRP